MKLYLRRTLQRSDYIINNSGAVLLQEITILGPELFLVRKDVKFVNLPALHPQYF